VSRQPVGQALSLLKAQGFVRDAGRRGLIVAPVERSFFRAIYQLREAIDPMAARLAADHGARVELVEGRRLVAVGREALQAATIEGLIASDMRFHLWVYQLSGNPLMLDTMRLYWNHLRRAMAEVLRPAETRAQVWDEHQAILEAIAARDADAAAGRALEHVRGAAERVADSIPQS
jgi:DNA-binding GntR family transcriptional regulator